MAAKTRPGVNVEAFAPVVQVPFQTGIPGFVAPYVRGTSSPEQAVFPYSSWNDFAYQFATRKSGGWAWNAGWRPDDTLWVAVQGFFANGGVRCHVAFFDPTTGDRRVALDNAVMALAENDEIDLLCAPSLVTLPDPLPLQDQLLQSSDDARVEHGVSWFVILDAPPGVDLAARVTAMQAITDAPWHAALYAPSLVPGGEFEPPPGATAPYAPVPPSGHIAGIYARTDQIGVQRAPANQEIIGIVDLASASPELDYVNPICVLPGRGIRVWGARTLWPGAGSTDSKAFVNTNRLVLMLERWLVRALDWVVYEPNDFRLWVRVHRELDDRLGDLFQRGAFQGKNPSDAYAIKCDDENNSADDRAAGRLQIDIQVAPAAPQEFVTIRLVRSAEGLTVQ